MKLQAGSITRAPVSAELDWCRANTHVPKAALALAIHDAIHGPDGTVTLPGGRTLSRKDPALDALLVDAVAALRRIHTRPMSLVDRFYAYVTFNPKAKVEAFIGAPEGLFMSPLMGCDLEHMRSMRIEAETIRRDYPDLKMVLWHYAFDRVIPPKKVAHLRSRNIPTRSAIEMFAWVAVHPESGDETVAGTSMPWRLSTMIPGPGVTIPPEQQVFVALVHGDAEALKAWKPITDEMLRSGSEIELRRFVRTEIVDEGSF